MISTPTTQSIRETFLKYFEDHGHTRKSSSSLVPSNDPTVLLTIAGMQQFIPYFLGEAKAPEKRYTSSQKCFRTLDIEEVGDDSHLTFFEMLGNFSIGDYFKEEAIRFHWELFTKVFGIDKNRLWITVFSGDKEMGLDQDEEAIKHWLAMGVPRERIVSCDKDDNFWGPPGETGPCGPSSEIHYDFGEGELPEGAGPNKDDGRILEIANIVFMEYYKEGDGSLRPLESKNVDQGTGLERLLLALEHQEALKENPSGVPMPSLFETDAFRPIVQVVLRLIEAEKNAYVSNPRPYRIIADHVRGAIFLIADGVQPGKEGREYVLRRILRRAIEASQYQLPKALGSLNDVVPSVIEHFKDAYPDLKEKSDHIKSVIEKEEAQYSEMLRRGQREIEKRLGSKSLEEFQTAENVFDLKETYGLTPETQEVMLGKTDAERNTLTEKEWHDFYANLDLSKLEEEKKAISRRGMKSKFDRAGGGSGTHVATAHTGTHLLHAAVRKVLSPEATQAGSQLGDGEFRFDFRWAEKLTDEQKKTIEDMLNEQIAKALPVVEKRMTVEEAKKAGAIALFEQRYDEEVRVFFIGEPGNEFSIEVCGGPHVTNTKDIGHFKILKEKSSSAGVRRIKAEVGKTPEGAELIL